MGIGISVFLITLGAILKFAITVDLSGVNIQAMGVILMIVGAAMFVLSLVFLPRRRESARREQQQAYDEGPPNV
ncbi:MAG: hypothetical protein GEV03_28190 [Streptosporangiales bacterium]|nr:hypothetical protein [Streptosporangiales bacterium]